MHLAANGERAAERIPELDRLEIIAPPWSRDRSGAVVVSPDPTRIDFDGDGEEELMWLASRRHLPQMLAWTFTAGRVQPFAGAPVPGLPSRVDEASPSGPLRLVYEIDLGPAMDCSEEETENDGRYPVPELFAEVIDGRLRLDTPAARQSVERWCAAAPAPGFRTALEVLCARFWGRGTNALLAAIEGRFAPGSCATTEPRPARGATLEYHPMLAAARFQPPFSLAQAAPSSPPPAASESPSSTRAPPPPL